MSNNLDLRKRILKMREVNIGPSSVESNNSDHYDTNSILVEKKNTTATNLKDINNKNITNKKSMKSDHQRYYDNIYDAQFILLANKFNEPVEVILELSDKVKNLEKIVYLKEKNIKKIGEKSKIPNVKIIIFIILIFIFTSGIVYLPINLPMLKLIMSEISSLI